MNIKPHNVIQIDNVYMRVLEVSLQNSKIIKIKAVSINSSIYNKEIELNSTTGDFYYLIITLSQEIQN